MLLLTVSLIAGVLTALAPCVLPLLPIIVGGSLATGERNRAYTITLSLGASVILFTLLLKASTVFINVPQIFWELFSGAIIVAFGLVMVYPRLWDSLGFVNILNRRSNRLLAAGYQKNSLWGDAIMGAALGPVFSSCSPTYFIILATVLPASSAMGLLDLFAYALGLSGFLLLIARAGQRLIDKLAVATEPRGWFRRSIGVLFIVVGLAVGSGAEASTEAWLLDRGFDLSFVEGRLLGAQHAVSDSQARAINTSIPAASATSSAYLSLEEKQSMFPKAPELASIDGYINTSGQPITIGQFKGKKVVLIDFWTYSCINCQRTLPYLKMWYEKYESDGLEIIGVHTPEFAFEHVLSNVQTAVDGFGITYPVVLDNEYATWNAFGNEYWPHKYLIDIDGYVVYDHAGEGNYDEAERAIEKALAERAARLHTPMTSGRAAAPESVVSVDSSQLGSPETYFGANRNEYLGNGVQGQTGEQTLVLPLSLQPNTLYLGGTWNFTGEYASNSTARARIVFAYRAKNVYLVAAPTSGQITIRVTRDGGMPLGAAAGKDVNSGGEATIDADRLYELISDTSYGAHTIEIEVDSPGLRAYTFTFG